MPRYRGRDRRDRQEIRPCGRSRDQRPHPSSLCLQHRRTAGHLGRQIRHAGHSNTLAKDPDQTALIATYDKLAAPIANRRAGSVTAALSRVPNEAGESALGDVVADAQLAATASAADGDAVAAFTNPGGLRADIAGKEDGSVTYADL